MDFPRFYGFFIDFTWFYLDSTGFSLILLGFIGFNCNKQSFNRLYLLYLGLTGFDLTLFIVIKKVPTGSTYFYLGCITLIWFYWVFTGFYWFLLVFTWFLTETMCCFFIGKRSPTAVPAGPAERVRFGAPRTDQSGVRRRRPAGGRADLPLAVEHVAGTGRRAGGQRAQPDGDDQRRPPPRPIGTRLRRPAVLGTQRPRRTAPAMHLLRPLGR